MMSKGVRRNFSKGDNIFGLFQVGGPGGGGEGTLISLTPKDKTIQNAKKPKKVVSLTLIGDLICPKK